MRALEIELEYTMPDRPAAWLVQQRSGGEWRAVVLPGHQRRALLEWAGEEPPALLVVRALSRTWVEGEPLVLAR